jgi:hypothetical protein
MLIKDVIDLFGGIFAIIGALYGFARLIGLIDRRRKENRRARSTAHWQNAERLICETFFPKSPDAPTPYAPKPFVTWIVTQLAGDHPPDESLYRVARLFVELCILARISDDRNVTDPATPQKPAAHQGRVRSFVHRMLSAAHRTMSSIGNKLLGLGPGEEPSEATDEIKKQIDEAARFRALNPNPKRFKTCFDVNILDEKDPKISTYLSVLADIQEQEYPDKQIAGIDPSDHCIRKITINKGFVAPTFLVTGLLSEFDEKWPKALDYFVDANRADARCYDSDDATMIQRFDFYCWLLWGPSIPACDCRRWSGDFMALQYGYGDENNSLPLIVDPRRMRQLISEIGAPVGQQIPVAFPKSLNGVIAWGPRLNEKTNIFPSIYSVPMKERAASDDGKQPSRLVVNHPPASDLHERIAIERKSALKDIVFVADEKVDWSAPFRRDESPYYSAYVWVMFEMCDASMEPLYSEMKDRWRVLLPIFEHTNVADGYTLNFLKRRLAEKAVSTIFELEAESGKPPTRRFRYICAFDDPGTVENGDGKHRLLFRSQQTDEMLRKELFAGGQAAVDAAWTTTENRIRTIIYHNLNVWESQERMFKPANERSNIITSCDLPDMIEQFYSSFPD